MDLLGVRKKRKINGTYLMITVYVAFRASTHALLAKLAYGAHSNCSY